MGAAGDPVEGVVAIYTGAMVVVLTLLSSALQQSRYVDMFTLSLAIAHVHVFGLIGWSVVLCLMTSRWASASAMEIVVFALFTYGASSEVAKQSELYKSAFDTDLVAAVVWAQLLAANHKVHRYEGRLKRMSSKELALEVRILYARLVPEPSSLPSGWLRSRHLTSLFFHVTKANMRTTRTGPDGLGADPQRALHSDTPRARGGWWQRIIAYDRADSERSKLSSPHICKEFLALPLLILLAFSLGLMYLILVRMLTVKVRADLARRLARRWLRVSLYGPPESFPHCNAWKLWALSTAVDEAQARDLTCAMTCPQGRTSDTWTVADARAALHRICGWDGDAGEWPSEQDRPEYRRLWLKKTRVGPDLRQTFFTFVLAAINMAADTPHAAANSPDVAASSTGAASPPAVPPCTLDDVIAGRTAPLAALYAAMADDVASRGAVLVAEIRDPPDAPLHHAAEGDAAGSSQSSRADGTAEAADGVDAEPPV